MENLENGEINKKSTIRKYAERMVIDLALPLVIPTFLAQAYKIHSGSMEPTLEIGDYILVIQYRGSTVRTSVKKGEMTGQIVFGVVK